jgi:hypothetical protein
MVKKAMVDRRAVAGGYVHGTACTDSVAIVRLTDGATLGGTDEG